MTLADSGDGALRGFDPENLYALASYHDPNAGTITVLTPVNENGVRDAKRSVLYRSSVMYAFMGRPMPLEFDIPAQTLAEALAAFPQAARAAMEAKTEELRRPQVMLPPDYPHRPS